MAAIAERHDAHAVKLRGPARSGAPAIVTDIEADDFVTALAAALQRSDWPRFGWPASLPLPLLAAHGAPRALFQPIHRRFNLVLLDTHCDVFGTPRLDPKKIDSMGFVVRRWAGADADAATPAAFDAPSNWLRWLERDGEPLGWQRIGDARDADADPDPARRPLPKTGHALLDARLAQQHAAAAGEAVNKLYPLPPEVNAHAQRTLLYGLVPCGDAQRKADAVAVDYSPARAPGRARDDFIAHLSPYLRREAERTLPDAGGLFDASWLDATQAAQPADAEAAPGAAGLRAQFTAFVRQLALEFEIESARAAPLRALLDEVPLRRRRVPLPLGQDPFEPIPSAAFWVACARLVSDDNAPAVPMPERFGPLPQGFGARFADAALDLLQQRSAEARTLQGRFDDATALYAIRAFIRVRRDDGCSPLLVWSEHTPLYRIAPWYASTGTPQAKIALPPFDKASLAAMKPNVAFELPPSLQNLLAGNSPTDLLESKGKKGSEIGLGWLCSFSIPIITICAFIALNVILALLNIFLRWMPLVKICLPVPVKKD